MTPEQSRYRELWLMLHNGGIGGALFRELCELEERLTEPEKEDARVEQVVE